MAAAGRAVFVFDIEDILITTIEPGGNSTVQRDVTSTEAIGKAVESVREIIALCEQRRISPLFFIYTLDTHLADIEYKLDIFRRDIPGFQFDKILYPRTAVNPRKTYTGIVHLYKKFYRGRPSCPVFIFDTEVYVSDMPNIYPFEITDAAFDEGHSWDVALNKVKEVLPVPPVIPVAPTPLPPSSLVAPSSLVGRESIYELSPMLNRLTLTPTKSSGGKRTRRKRRVRKSRKTRAKK